MNEGSNHWVQEVMRLSDKLRAEYYELPRDVRNVLATKTSLWELLSVISSAMDDSGYVCEECGVPLTATQAQASERETFQVDEDGSTYAAFECPDCLHKSIFIN